MRPWRPGRKSEAQRQRDREEYQRHCQIALSTAEKYKGGALPLLPEAFSCWRCSVDVGCRRPSHTSKVGGASAARGSRAHPVAGAAVVMLAARLPFYASEIQKIQRWVPPLLHQALLRIL